MTPRLYIFWPISNQGADNIGSTGWGIAQEGWRQAIDKYLRPWIEWAKAADPNVGVMPHLCFGQYGFEQEDMRLDAWDWAKASGTTKLFDPYLFADAWKPITSTRECTAYSGDLDKAPIMPATDARLLMERNLAPYVKAGFHRVCIDAASDAITHPATVNGETINRSINSVLLSYADTKFPQPAAIEATPRRFKAWRQLAKRDVVLQESAWRNRHGLPSEVSGQAIAKGYGPDTDYLTGRILRIVDANADNPALMLADAQRIAREGCIPVVPAWAMVGKVDAAAIFEGVTP